MGPDGHETWRSWVDATLPPEGAPTWPLARRRSLSVQPPASAGQLLAALRPDTREADGPA